MQKPNPLLRLVAAIVDGLILSIPYYLIMGILGTSVSLTPPSDPEQFAQWLQSFSRAGMLVNVLQTVISVAYFSLFWVKKGATPGKMLVGVKVVKVDGSRLTYGDAILRYIGYIVDALVCCLGYIWILFDEKGQGWHDKIAQTMVVKR